ncbi:MAG: cache domain-containing protein [Actinomycetota bacterium]
MANESSEQTMSRGTGLVERVRQPRLAARLAVLVLAGVVGLGAVAWLGLQDLRGELENGYALQVESVTETAYGVLEQAYAREQAGELTREEAQTLAFDVIRELGYGDGEYFFVIQHDGLYLAHGANSALEGQNLIDLEDPEGTPLVAELSAVSANGGSGFVEYLWPPPGDPEGTPIPKLSYAHGFEPWDLFVGTGVYIDNIDTAYASSAQTQFMWIAGIVALVALVAWLIARSIRGPLSALIKRMAGLTEGDNESPVSGVERRDEVGEIARAVEVFRQNALEKLELEAAAEEDARRRVEAEAAAEAEQRRVLAETADSFEAEVGGIVQRVGASSEDLRGAAASLADAAEMASTSATNVSSQASIGGGRRRGVRQPRARRCHHSDPRARRSVVGDGAVGDGAGEVDRPPDRGAGRVGQADR